MDDLYRNAAKALDDLVQAEQDEAKRLRLLELLIELRRIENGYPKQ